MSNNLLAGKRGIIFGALNENSIAWKVAQQAVKQGAKITLTNAPIALRMGEMNKLAAECNAEIIAADVTSMDGDSTMKNDLLWIAVGSFLAGILVCFITVATMHRHYHEVIKTSIGAIQAKR